MSLKFWMTSFVECPLTGLRKHVDAVSHLFDHKTSRVDLLRSCCCEKARIAAHCSDSESSHQHKGSGVHILSYLFLYPINSASLFPILLCASVHSILCFSYPQILRLEIYFYHLLVLSLLVLLMSLVLLCFTTETGRRLPLGNTSYRRHGCLNVKHSRGVSETNK